MSKENALRRAAIAAHVAKVASQEKKRALNELMEVMAPGDRSYATAQEEAIRELIATGGISLIEIESAE